uniref:pectate lyase-like adhesive domain-containing protein n=1 Tax=Acetatifactor sp. TaxID=1872090 RepID=UPI0040286C3D
MVLSLVSMPVSAAETGQLTNPPTSTEELHSPESASGNEAAAVLNGLYAALPVANGVKEVATADELTDALADSSISIITLKDDVEISSTLTVNRTVTLDLNGNVLKMTGSGSVIKVESDGNLTIADSNKTTQHNFNPNCKYLTWYIDMWKLDKDGTEIVSGGVITGGGGDFVYNDGGGVYNSGSFIMSGGTIKASISTTTQYASSGGVRNDNQFTMTGGTIGDPTNPNDASSVYNTSSQRVILTICDNAKIYTNVTNVGILNADGGEIAGTMTNDTNEYGSGTITLPWNSVPPAALSSRAK